eukprot:1785574-Amphidinium_carterae.1
MDTVDASWNDEIYHGALERCITDVLLVYKLHNGPRPVKGTTYAHKKVEDGSDDYSPNRNDYIT